MNEFADLPGGDDVFAALKDERRDVNPGEVAAVVGGKGDPRKRLRDVRIGSAKAVGQFRTELGTIRIAHDRRRHLRGPAHVIGFKKLQKLFDLLFAKAAHIVAVVDVAG
jgi:hypothetical protein